MRSYARADKPRRAIARSNIVSLCESMRQYLRIGRRHCCVRKDPFAGEPFALTLSRPDHTSTNCRRIFRVRWRVAGEFAKLNRRARRCVCRSDRAAARICGRCNVGSVTANNGSRASGLTNSHKGTCAASGPNTINRENVQRRIIIQANVADRDLGSVIQDVRLAIRQKVRLPQGYFVQYGGQFESQEKASR
jgi:hypothetical protein